MMLAGCQPDFGTPQSLVTSERVLAIVGEPAEVQPGSTATMRALVVSPDGTLPAPLDWGLCLTPKPLDENNVVSNDCLSNVMDEGTAPMQTVAVPLNACALFGPDPPPQMPGQPPLRPRDPDVSGGYYQPVRATVDGVVGFGLERITCNLANAGADIAVQFAMQYQANHNPTLSPVTAAVNGQPVAFDPTTNTFSGIPTGATVTFTAGWPADSVEMFPIYDPSTVTITMHREAMRLSWFATGGSFVHEHTGTDENDPSTSSDDGWTAPATAGLVHLWVVLRDSRGGQDFASYDLLVGP